jgi:pimeloyl-ACP methyl ester carboxylesterase
MHCLTSHIEIQGHRIEYELERGGGRPVMVFLHEGLGSLAMWKDFPTRCAAACGCDALVYSRYGYGKSDPLKGSRGVGFMHDEARKALPELLGKLEVERPVLFGHSDGASIALIYAAEFEAAGVIALAPHVVVEEFAIVSIRATKKVYETTDLRDKLARYHDYPDSAFWGWNDVWLDPEFREWNIEELLPKIKCPVLAIQGFDDEYGTMEQIHRIEAAVPRIEVVKLERCRHSPHRDQPDAVIAAAARFVRDTPNGTETRPLPAI